MTVYGWTLVILPTGKGSVVGLSRLLSGFNVLHQPALPQRANRQLHVQANPACTAIQSLPGARLHPPAHLQTPGRLAKNVCFALAKFKHFPLKVVKLLKRSNQRFHFHLKWKKWGLVWSVYKMLKQNRLSYVIELNLRVGLVWI